MIHLTSLTDHPREGGDLVPQGRDLLKEVPAFARMSGIKEHARNLPLTSKAQAQRLLATARKQPRAYL